MIVGAFFAAARALGGILSIVYFLASTDFSNDELSLGGNLVNTLKATQVSTAVSSVTVFFFLFFAGRWMLRGPKLLERWLDEGEKSEGPDSSL